MNINANTSRGDLEIAILENDIHATDAAGLAKLTAMSDDELRAMVVAWIEAGDECGASR